MQRLAVCSYRRFLCYTRVFDDMQAKLPAGEPSPRAAFYFIEPVEAGYARPLQGNSYLVILVIIDEASIGQDLPLGVGHGAEFDGELYQPAVWFDSNGLDLTGGLQQRLAHTG